MDVWKEKSSNKKKVKVGILGRGKENVTVDQATTIKDLRDILNLDSDIKALDKHGHKLKDTESVSDRDDVNFVPNIEGGC